MNKGYAEYRYRRSRPTARPAEGDNGDIVILWLSVLFENIAKCGPEDIAHIVTPFLHRTTTKSLAANDMLIFASERRWLYFNHLKIRDIHGTNDHLWTF